MTQYFNPGVARAAGTPVQPAKKVYYVLKHSGGYYVQGMHTGRDADLYYSTLSIKSAKQLASVLDAALLAAKHADAKGVGTVIVRVEETPGTRTLRLVHTSGINATKPVVLYNARRKEYGAWRGPGVGMLSVRSIQGATVFPDLGEAIEALTIDASDLGKGYMHETTHIHQVEYVTTEPTVTETALS